MVDLHSLGVILFGLAVGAFVKGLTGMGLPLVAIPFMAAFVGAEHAIVVMQVPGLVSNAWLVWSNRKQAREVPLRYDMIVPAVVMTVVGVWFLEIADNRTIILLLAAVVAAFLVLLASRPFRLTGAAGRVIPPAAGLIGGFAQGATGVSGPLFSAVILAFRFRKEGFVYYNGLVFGLFNFVQAVAMLSFGMFTWQRTFEGLLALAPLFVFQHLGMKAMGMVSLKVFNGAVIAVIALMEIKLVYEGLLR